MTTSSVRNGSGDSGLRSPLQPSTNSLRASFDAFCVGHPRDSFRPGPPARAGEVPGTAGPERGAPVPGRRRRGFVFFSESVSSDGEFVESTPWGPNGSPIGCRGTRKLKEVPMSLPDGSRLLDGKVAVVLGASSGIGWAIAERFAEQGAKVVVAARTPAGEPRKVGRPKIDGVPIRCDGSDFDQLGSLAEDDRRALRRRRRRSQFRRTQPAVDPSRTSLPSCSTRSRASSSSASTTSCATSATPWRRGAAAPSSTSPRPPPSRCPIGPLALLGLQGGNQLRDQDRRPGVRPRTGARQRHGPLLRPHRHEQLRRHEGRWTRPGSTSTRKCPDRGRPSWTRRRWPASPRWTSAPTWRSSSPAICRRRSRGRWCPWTAATICADFPTSAHRAAG